MGCHALLQGIFPTQGSNLSPTLQVDSLPTKSHGKPKNTGVGSLSLLQRIFLIQEPNRGLLHCRWILYQLSHKGSPCHYFCYYWDFEKGMSRCEVSEVKRSEVAQLCPTLCDPMNCSPPGSSSMGFSRQECWSRLLFPFPGYFSDLRSEPGSPALQADSLPAELPEKP